MNMTYLLWLGILHVLCIMPEVAVCMKTVTLEVIQPSTGPVCPGQEVILTCTAVRTDAIQELYLNWKQGTGPTLLYDSNNPSTVPQTLGDFITTAMFMSNTTSTVIVSNATLKSVALSHNNSMITCKSPPQDNTQTATITIAGNNNIIGVPNIFFRRIGRCRRYAI